MALPLTALEKTNDQKPGPSTHLGARVKKYIANQWMALASFIGVILIWEIYVRLAKVPAYVLPAPSVILQAMIEESPELLKHSWYTLYEVILGFLIGGAIGIPLAILIVYSKFAEKTIYAFLVASQAIPKVALAPLLIAWFSYGMTPKIVITTLMCFFPIVVNTVVGLNSTPSEMLYLARSLGASGFETFWKFRFPHGLPSIFAGLKVATSLAVVGAVVGEYVAGVNGLGYVQMIRAAFVRTTSVFAILMYLSILGIVLFNLISYIEKRVIRWDPKQQFERAQE
ncbi:MAG: ABC transporter permease [Anaerolineaceae bacterium]|nr:ABC transporter permease [Anaerolineaceae bacterium]